MMKSAALPETSSSTPRVHLAFLDGLRGLAALYVALYHTVQATDAHPLPAAFQMVTRPLRFGHIGVDIFIVLSGFCLMLPVVKRGQIAGGFRSYLTRRARRILPPYYAAIVLSLLLTVVASRVGHNKEGWRSVLSAGDIVSHLLVVHNWFRDYNMALDGSTWSVATEWQIYFLFPALLLPLWRRLGAGMVPVAFAGALLPHFLLPPAHNFDWACPWYVGLFACGMMGAVWSLRPETLPLVPPARRRTLWSIISGILCVGVVLLCWRHGELLGFAYMTWGQAWGPDILVGLAAASVMAWASASLDAHPKQGVPAVVRVLQAPASVFLGVFSYSLYLVHTPVMLAVQATLQHFQVTSPVVWAAGMGGAFVLALVAAYVFHRLFERPFLNTRRGETLAETARDAALSPAP